MKHDLRCGDCTGLIKTLPDCSVDMTLTSPPYDGLREYQGAIGQWNSAKFRLLAHELLRVTRPGGVVVWVVGDASVKGSETGTSFRQALYFMGVGFRLHDTMIYRKKNPIPQNHGRYEQSFEYMFCFSKGKPAVFNGIREPCVDYGKGTPSTPMAHEEDLCSRRKRARKPILPTKLHANVFEYCVGGGESRNHPAVFPLKLAEDQIITWSREGDIVLDPLMGSGTTGIVCRQTNRNFIGFEINENYFKEARRRIAEPGNNE